MAGESTQAELTGLGHVEIASQYQAHAQVTLYEGDCAELLPQIPAGEARLVVTSPPYNIGKAYETRRALDEYVGEQARVIGECVRILADDGSICWQVGNHIGDDGEVVPLDVVLYPVFKGHGLKLRNRIVWHFGHGLHCARRFSGRYEVILWFTKTGECLFNLDAVRVPQKYPGKKHFKGPHAGEYSGNPLGKSPTDVWEIPNVKSNHVEKTIHPCQFPVELVQRLVLSMTKPGDLVVDPYMGVGTTAAAAVLCGRRAAGAEISPEYMTIARDRVRQAAAGTLRVRPMQRAVYRPTETSSLARRPAEWDEGAQGRPK